MYCPNCGTEFENGVNFCPKCGTQRPQPTTVAESKTGSGLPDFRTPSGLYGQKGGANYPRTAEQSAPPSSPIADTPTADKQPTDQSSDVASSAFKDISPTKKKSKLPLILGIVSVIIVAFIVIAALLGGGSSPEISTVRNGYLGEYTDMTVNELLDGYYSDTLGYDEGVWDSGITDDGTTLVQVQYTDEVLDPVTIQFSMLNEDCFKVTAFVDPSEDVEDPSDLLATLNKIYIVSYEVQYPQEEWGNVETELLERLASVNATSVRYGASKDYTGDRSRLYELFDDTPLEMTVVELLNFYGFYGIVDTEIYTDESELPNNPYEFTKEEIASLERVSVDSLANYMMPDYDGQWILLTDVYIDSIGYDGTDSTLMTAIGINSSYLNITCYDTDTYHASNILSGTDMIGRCVYHENGKYYEVVDAILYNQSPADILATNADNAYSSGQEAAWNVYASAAQGSEGYCVAQKVIASLYSTTQEIRKPPSGLLDFMTKQHCKLDLCPGIFTLMMII